MSKRNRWFAVSTMLIVLTVIIGTWTVQAQAIKLSSIDYIEQEQIKETVKAYFEMRYRSFNTLKLEDLWILIDSSSQGNYFLRSESDKLEIELHHAKLNRLRYLQYEYFLVFNDISIDLVNHEAIVSVIEGHDVIFEISKEISISDPLVSSMRNLQHTIVLRKQADAWKMLSDDYGDYLWRFIKATGLSKEEYLHSTDDLTDIMNDVEGYFATTSSCNLYDDETTYPYNRDGAVSYAHTWATAPRPYHDPPYHDFTDEGGDCTNFVSQAIHEGGGALMVFDDEQGIGMDGWYYNNVNDRAAAWLDVTRLYNFIVNEVYFWDAGPEGCDAVIDQASRGDVIQYDWQNDGSWDHSVMIVLSQYDPTYHWVAGHSPDVDGYPYTHFIYTHPNMVYRFVHIVRLDAASSVKLPIVMNSESSMAIQMQNPYPAPVAVPIEASEPMSPSPYPAP